LSDLFTFSQMKKNECFFAKIAIMDIAQSANACYNRLQMR